MIFSLFFICFGFLVVKKSKKSIYKLKNWILNQNENVSLVLFFIIFLAHLLSNKQSTINLNYVSILD